jgi:hypothetical protein
VALRPTLSSGLPFSSFLLENKIRICKGNAEKNKFFDD